MTAVPKYVDKDERRRKVAGALRRIAARQGLEGVSVRTVAAEAGISAGAVQRDFATKDDLLLFALRDSLDAVTERFSRIRIGPGLLTFAEGLRAVLVDLLPTDEERLAQARVWAAFYAGAAVSEDFARVLAEYDEQSRAALRKAVAYAAEQGELAPGLEPEQAVELVLVLLDGIWLRVARQTPDTPEQDGRAAVDAAVAAVTGRPAPGNG
ncbi:TetR family transcriptional regulator C-terminal domain-containing protein [Nocardiopsis sp. HNM0947]|uniref:TetR family transcriptional regulator C-terminal domain-containing protein n=1 Tax=Nocardiopsis coralli TaxID=2772213 RepID=A0ABR9P4S9_9ACTN|nr:TetR family transcriptional regulator C-terminal domain-containing protein [Nocardiopsis coralli]MBE2998851.1 TetR family transcriptional regulator C-terminal domain-containing protein [Nocardiopsis coralli]